MSDLLTAQVTLFWSIEVDDDHPGWYSGKQVLTGSLFMAYVISECTFLSESHEIGCQLGKIDFND